MARVGEDAGIKAEPASAGQNILHEHDGDEDVAAAQTSHNTADDEAMAYAMAYEELSD